MNRFRAVILLLALLLTPLAAQAELRLSGQLTQGGLVSGRVPPGTRVYYQDRLLRLTTDGQFILGFGRDAEPRQSLTLIAPDGHEATEELLIAQRRYKIQRINGISRELMKPTAEDLLRIEAEAEQVDQARQADSDLRDFQETFIWPVTGPITGVYGSQRILNGEKRRPHFGVDISAPLGTLVIAPAGGIVTLSHPGMFYSGATLIIDHGHGLSSSFLHLDKILVKVGERVAQGQPIARVGSSGRVTGPHLDWRINWFGARLDPQLFFP
jgi:murein DD-endopeptidase MepM/ murein hydrolase activator NlpD